MNTAMNNLLITAANLFELFIMYRYMCIFFETRRSGMRFAVIMYSLHFLCGEASLLWAMTPLIHTIMSLVSFFLLTLCYEASLTKRLIVAILLYLCLLNIEALVAYERNLSSFRMLRESGYSDSLLSIEIEIAQWLLTILLFRFHNVKKNRLVSKTFLLEVIVIFVTSFVIDAFIISQDNIHSVMSLPALVSVMLMDFVLLYHYDTLSGMLEEQRRRELAQQAEKYYHRQAEMIQANYQEIHEFRHEMKNRLVALKELIDKNETGELNKYLNDLERMIVHTRVFSQTGNLAIDSIINYKLSIAEKNGIDVETEIAVSIRIRVEDDDLVIILGNLLDNAIEACERLTEGRRIRLVINSQGECLFIKLQNTFDAIVDQADQQFLTRKSDRGNHGIGMNSVRKAVEKYHGEMDVRYDNESFLVAIIF